VSCLRENLTSSSYGEGLETGRQPSVPRQSFTRQALFKALKQSLRIKTFVGTSENAVLIQIWTALIAMLVVKYLQLKSTFGWSLSNLVALLRQQLFVYRDLWSWINEPFQAPPGLGDGVAMQLELFDSDGRQLGQQKNAEAIAAS
jgi:hypothetical protein